MSFLDHMEVDPRDMPCNNQEGDDDGKYAEKFKLLLGALGADEGNPSAYTHLKPPSLSHPVVDLEADSGIAQTIAPYLKEYISYEKGDFYLIDPSSRTWKSKPTDINILVDIVKFVAYHVDQLKGNADVCKLWPKVVAGESKPITSLLKGKSKVRCSFHAYVVAVHC